MDKKMVPISGGAGRDVKRPMRLGAPGAPNTARIVARHCTAHRLFGTSDAYVPA
jgi:hypothetical protein